jgi:hypothetical protein
MSFQFSGKLAGLSKQQRAFYRALRKFGMDEEGALRLIATSGGGTPNASFTITRVDGLSDANLIAPAGVMLRASSLTGFNVTEPAGDTNVYDPTQHRVSFIWNFGDPGYSRRFTPNIPTAQLDTNIAFGKSVAHVFGNSGNYTVQCWAFDDAGNWGTATYTFQTGGNAGPIRSQDEAFPGTLTICYSPDNNFVGAPSGSSNQTTLLGVRNAVATAGSRCRVLFRRGETYTGPYTNGPANGIGRSGGTSFYYGAYGTGANPVINVAAGGMLWMQDVFGGACAVDGLDFVGGWDSTTETGRTGDIFGTLGQYMEYLVFHRCLISGLGFINYQSTGNATAEEGCTWFHDTRITNWKDFGIFGGLPRKFAVIGCDWSQHVDALMGINQLVYNSPNPVQLGNTHGPIRNSDGTAFRHLYVACTSFFSRNGWSGNGSGGNLPTVAQGCWRMTPNPTPFRAHMMFDRCSFESSGVALTVQSVGDPASTGYWRNMVIDKCLFVGSAYGAAGEGNTMMILRNPGVTIRNCYFYRPDVDRKITEGMFQNGVVNAVLTTGTPASLADTPDRFYNNTCWLPSVQSRIGTTAPVFFTSNGVNDVAQNNVFFAPNLTTPIGASFAPLTSTPLAGFQCQFKGGRWNPPPIGSPNSPSGILSVTSRRENPGVPGTLQAGTVANGESIILPYPNYTGTPSHGGYTLNVTQAMMTGNPTQRHQFSVSSVTQRRSDPVLWPEGNGGVTISFQPTFIRVTNNTGSSWASGDAWLQLDLAAQLMAFETGSASPANVPNGVAGTGSAARNAYNTGLRAREDFFMNVRPGERNTNGTIQTGTADLGHAEVA